MPAEQMKSTLSVPDEGAPDSAIREIDIMELMYRLLEKAKYIILVAVLGAIISAIWTIYFVTPMYQATSKLYILNNSDSAINLSDLQVGAYLTSDYQEVFKTWEVHENVISNLNLDYSYGQMQSMISIANPSNTRMLYITATCDDPLEAKDIANEYAKVAKQYISEKMASDEPNILSEALEPSAPSSPNKTRNILIGFLLGALLMVGIITIRFVTDDRIKTADEVHRYIGLATLAVIPKMNNDNKKKGKQRK